MCFTVLYLPRTYSFEILGSYTAFIDLKITALTSILCFVICDWAVFYLDMRQHIYYYNLYIKEIYLM